MKKPRNLVSIFVQNCMRGLGAVIFDATLTLSFNDDSKRRGSRPYDEVYLFLASCAEALRRVTHQEIGRKPAGKITPSATVAPISVALPSPSFSAP